MGSSLGGLDLFPWCLRTASPYLWLVVRRPFSSLSNTFRCHKRYTAVLTAVISLPSLLSSLSTLTPDHKTTSLHLHRSLVIYKRFIGNLEPLSARMIDLDDQEDDVARPIKRFKLSMQKARAANLWRLWGDSFGRVHIPQSSKIPKGK